MVRGDCEAERVIMGTSRRVGKEFAIAIFFLHVTREK